MKTLLETVHETLDNNLLVNIIWHSEKKLCPKSFWHCHFEVTNYVVVPRQGPIITLADMEIFMKQLLPAEIAPQQSIEPWRQSHETISFGFVSCYEIIGSLMLSEELRTRNEQGKVVTFQKTILKEQPLRSAIIIHPQNNEKNAAYMVECLSQEKYWGTMDFSQWAAIPPGE